jgi:hypothetical protein
MYVKGTHFFSNLYSCTLAVLLLTVEVDPLRRIMWDGARQQQLQQNVAALMRDDVKANATMLFGTGSMCIATDDSGVAVDGSEDCWGCWRRLSAVEDNNNPWRAMAAEDNGSATTMMSANNNTEGWGHSGAAAAGGGVGVYLFIYLCGKGGQAKPTKCILMYSPHTSPRDLREESYIGEN